MSFFKKLIKGIVIGAAVGFTGGLALGAIGITAIGGTAITAAGLATWGAVYGGLQGAAMGLVKPPKMSTQDVQARANISVDSQALGKWIFGETAAATDAVYSENINNKQICQIIAAAAHEIDSYQAFYINDELVTFSGANATGDWANVLSIYRNLGTSTQSALSIPSSSWPSSATGKGIAHYGLLWNFDSDNGKKKLSGGIPTRITQVVRGSKVYDPRKDSTNGGSGSHRVNDQSTWEFSSNWALIVAHYLLGYRSNGQLIFGVGVDASEIDWPQVIAMANVCDTTIDSKPKYRIGGILPMSQDHEYIIGQLEATVGGKVSKVGGKYFIWCPHDDLSPAGTLTDADIVAGSGISFSPAAPIETLYNTARGQYVDPALLYQLKPYPEVAESSAVSEDGKCRLMDRDFAFIQDESIAQRVAREMVRRTRFTGTIRVVVGPRGLLIRPFDVINVNFRETNFTNELFRVVEMQYSAQGAVVLELLEEDASIYDVTAPLGTSLLQNDPNAYNPGATIAAPTSFVISEYNLPRSDGSINALISVSWTAPDSAFIREYELQYKLTSESNYVSELVKGTRFEASGQIVGKNYNVRVRAIGIEGGFSDWLSTTYTIQGDTTGPAAPTGLVIYGNYNEAVAVWSPSTAKDYKETILYASLTNNFATATEQVRVSGNTVTYYNLPLNTTYYVWLRHVDFSGNLSSVSSGVSFSTTAGVSTSQIAPNAATLFYGLSADFSPGIAIAETASNVISNWTNLGSATVNFSGNPVEYVTAALSLNYEGQGSDSHVISLALVVNGNILARVDQTIEGAQEVTVSLTTTQPWSAITPPSGTSVLFYAYTKISTTGTDVNAMSAYFNVLGSRR